MTRISAQVSVYPLRQLNLAPAIEDAVQVCYARGLEVHPGTMSTLIVGDDEEVFSSLKTAMRSAATRGDVVMVVTFSNACPSFSPPHGGL
jgi:uncharacterized protein YqgV (UPF0045/DUF77 family)